MTMSPLYPGKAPFTEMRVAIPIKLTTDPWSDQEDDGYGARILRTDSSSDGIRDRDDTSTLNQPEYYAAPPSYTNQR